LNIVSELEQALFGKSTISTCEPEFHLSVSEDRKRTARELLGYLSGQAAAPLVLLCPGSVNSRAKRWPAERYAALADRFAEVGGTVALIGSSDELEVTERVCALTQRRPLVLTGKTSVAEVTALIRIADVLITNDTGPAHIGAAVGTPTIVIFGPTNPLTTRPFGPSGVMIRHPPDCAPCMLRDCPIDHRCMTAISPDEVFDRALQSMRQRVEVGV
jgi:heptosyltransferase-2